MKKLLIVLFIFLLSMSAYADIGYEQDNPDDFKILKKDILKASSTEPAITSFDLSEKMPEVMDQGQLGSCTSWAVGYYLNGYLQSMENGWLNYSGSKFSPSFLYNYIKNYQPTTGGTSFGDNFNVLLNQGGSRWGYMPYTTDSTVKPSIAALTDANLFKIDEYGLISVVPNDIDSFKNYLTTQEIPICIAIQVKPDFDSLNSNNQVYDDYSGNLRGYHAITIVGFDDSKNAFKIINSWGKEWGLSGYGWLSYDYIYPLYGYSAIPCENGSQTYLNETYISKYKQVTLTNYVGSQWKFYINNKAVKTSTKIYTTNPKINLKVVEDDPVYDDISTVTKTLNYGSNIINIIIMENGGKYKGKTVTLQFTIIRK